MSRLHAFLNPIQTEETREVTVSQRFLEDGKPVPFRIRAITQEENDGIIRRCTVKGKGGESLDKTAYNRRLVLASVVEPDLSDAELCRCHGVVDPAETAGKMLLAGEYAALLTAIAEINGFGGGSVEEEAKNF